MVSATPDNHVLALTENAFQGASNADTGVGSLSTDKTQEELQQVLSASPEKKVRSTMERL
jgi:hypothetical protein